KQCHSSDTIPITHKCHGALAATAASGAPASPAIVSFMASPPPGEATRKRDSMEARAPASRGNLLQALDLLRRLVQQLGDAQREVLAVVLVARSQALAHGGEQVGGGTFDRRGAVAVGPLGKAREPGHRFFDRLGLGLELCLPRIGNRKGAALVVARL